MASNFAFYPQSQTTLNTVGSASITLTMSLNLQSGTGTLGISSGNYQVSGCRIANTGTANVHVMFTAAGTSAPTINQTNGFPILFGTVETFRTQGLPVVQMLVRASEGSTTVWITAGEGL